MRRCLLATILLALSSAMLAQQSPEMSGAAIGHPPPLPGPPPLGEPAPATTPSTQAPAVQGNQPPADGAPAATGNPAKPSSSGILPAVTTGPGLIRVGPDGIHQQRQ